MGGQVGRGPRNEYPAASGLRMQRIEISQDDQLAIQRSVWIKAIRGEEKGGAIRGMNISRFMQISHGRETRGQRCSSEATHRSHARIDIHLGFPMVRMSTSRRPYNRVASFPARLSNLLFSPVAARLTRIRCKCRTPRQLLPTLTSRDIFGLLRSSQDQFGAHLGSGSFDWA